MHCGSCNLYTLEKKCPKCNKETQSNKPARYSIEDKYGEYRRKAKKLFKG
ncbi:MAG: RNA-protein complex protein Nop10 [Candidatus Nanoarchaeia archaeon]|nr:RNA-protein complex protein Nop10 [Candidatus Nanoarchaeia archaeon]